MATTGSGAGPPPGADAAQQGGNPRLRPPPTEPQAAHAERLTADDSRYGTAPDPRGTHPDRLRTITDPLGTGPARSDTDTDPLGARPERLGADAVLLGFVRALRAAGVGASSERLYAFLRAVSALRPGVRADVYWAGRATLCGGHDDLERYERVFAAYFGPSGEQAPRPVRAAPPPRLRLVARQAPHGAPAPGEGEPPGPPVAA
ncbi:hypothetical protein AB0C13_35520, partial [Streptomyces sp. NPDC049099]